MEVITVLNMPKSKLILPPLRLTSDETMGQRLARLRKERGLTQVELATRVGIIQGLVTNYERNKLRMHPEMVVRFAMALGVSGDELLGIPTKKATPPRARLSLRLVKRLQKIEKLSGPKQKVLLHTIDVFLRESEQQHRG
jgi:transcriptional regulator with XRE-family HTH domain